MLASLILVLLGTGGGLGCMDWKASCTNLMTCIFHVLQGIFLGLIITGIVAYSHPNLAGIQGFVFFIAGFICLAPGGYHLVYVYLAVKGKRGFDFHHLPLFN